MAQRQFRSDDTEKWQEGYGTGKDGDITISTGTTFATANAGCSGSSGSTSLTLAAASTFANGDLVLIHQSRGSSPGGWELNKILSGGGTTSLTLKYKLCNTYTDSGNDQAQIVRLLEANNVTVNASQIWYSSIWDGSIGGMLVFLARGNYTVNGLVYLQGRGYYGGPNGGDTSPRDYGAKGEASTVAATTNNQASGVSQNTGGGGGQKGIDPGAFEGGGGGGGSHATSGTDGQAVPTYTYPGLGATATSGNAGCTLMTFGGGGGTGGYNKDGQKQGRGGYGGGLHWFACRGNFSFGASGSINCSGENGQSAGSAFCAGGGGGAGGTVCGCVGGDITLDTNKITSVGGTGGYGNNSSTGGTGGSGRIHLNYARTISGTTNPTYDGRADKTLLRRRFFASC